MLYTRLVVFNLLVFQVFYTNALALRVFLLYYLKTVKKIVNFSHYVNNWFSLARVRSTDEH